MIPISTNLSHCIHKYPACSKNAFAEKKNQRPFRKGNHNIISIFSFRCLNWHEEYNQIRLLTVTHMPLQEREKYHLPACISGQDFFFFSFFLVLCSFSFFASLCSLQCRYLSCEKSVLPVAAVPANSCIC